HQPVCRFTQRTGDSIPRGAGSCGRSTLGLVLPGDVLPQDWNGSNCSSPGRALVARPSNAYFFRPCDAHGLGPKRAASAGPGNPSHSSTNYGRGSNAPLGRPAQRRLANLGQLLGLACQDSFYARRGCEGSIVAPVGVCTYGARGGHGMSLVLPLKPQSFTIYGIDDSRTHTVALAVRVLDEFTQSPVSTPVRVALSLKTAGGT